MEITNREHAFIDEAKLRDYLLSRKHPLGRFKAAFFAGLGYTEENWEMLRSDLRSQHLSLDAEHEQVTAAREEVRDCRPADRPFWNGRGGHLDMGDEERRGFPQVVTAYPAGAMA